ncbi:MAG TPA: helix-turn-helix domain-containing protein [Pyrinomonadaceae bacterium]
MLLKFINEATRTLGEGEEEKAFLAIGVSMREHIKKLKGARLHVFIVIALHADKQGWAWPTVARIRKQTGYLDDTIYKALSDLEELRINGRRLFLRTQVAPPQYKPKPGASYARNFYLLCPSVEECAHFDALRPAIKRGVSKENSLRKTGYGLTDSDQPGTDFQGTKKIHRSQAETGSGSEAETHTQGGPRRARRVRVSNAKSSFSEEQVLEWATHEAKQTGSTIRDPKALAVARHLDGAADPQIEQYFSNKSQPPTPPAKRCDPSCPKCFGTGHEQMPGGGVRLTCSNSQPQAGASA